VLLQHHRHRHEQPLRTSRSHVTSTRTSFFLPCTTKLSSCLATPSPVKNLRTAPLTIRNHPCHVPPYAARKPPCLPTPALAKQHSPYMASSLVTTSCLPSKPPCNHHIPHCSPTTHSRQPPCLPPPAHLHVPPSFSSLSLSLPLTPTSSMNVTTILHPQVSSTTSNALPCTPAHLHSNPVARSHHHLHHPISSIAFVPHHLTLKGAMRHPPMHLQTHVAVTVTPTNTPFATVSVTKYFNALLKCILASKPLLLFHHLCCHLASPPTPPWPSRLAACWSSSVLHDPHLLSSKP